MNTFTRHLSPFAALLLGSTALQAETVTLTNLEGTTSVTGDLVSYDGAQYVVETSLGELILEASQTVCTGAGCPSILSEMSDIRLAGSGTVTAHLIPELAASFFGQVSASAVRSDVDTSMTYYEFDRLNTSNLMMTLIHSNSQTGLAGMIDGQVNAAFTTRPATAQEVEQAVTRGLGDLRTEAYESVIAYDALLVVTHPTNPVRAMTEMDIASIFAGETVDWAAFDGPSSPINIYIRDDESNANSLLRYVLMDPQRQTVSDQVTVLGSDAEIAEAVRNDPNGIGLTSYVHRSGVNALEIEGVCGIRVPATPFTIQTAEYPLARPIYFYHSATADETVNSFADYLVSTDAQAIIDDAGFVTRSIASAPINMQGLRVTNTVLTDGVLDDIEGARSMLRLMTNSERLSSTIRFDGGSVELDSTDYEELEHLAELIRDEQNAGANFYFMGFSDSVGRADLNQIIALQRAEIVRQALISRHPDLTDRITAQTVSFGELSPLGCNETRPGRESNRRVEVWIDRTD